MAHIRWGGGRFGCWTSFPCVEVVKFFVVASFLVQFSKTTILLSAGELDGESGLGLRWCPFGPTSVGPI